MKIQTNDPMARLKQALDRLEDADRSRDAGRARDSLTSKPQDAFQISRQAQEFERVRDAAMASPEVRQALVDQVRDEIASGRYRVDGTRIAEALLHEELP